MASLGTTVLFNTDEKLIRADEFNPYLYIIIAGAVCLDSSGEAITTLSGHKILGALSASGMGYSLASITAIDHVVAIAFPVDAIADLSIKYDEFAEKIRDIGMVYLS